MNKKFWTFRFALINITYFAVFCTIHAFAGVFLTEKGFSNTLLGFVIAAGNILSVILQPIVAGIIDKKGFLTNRIAVMGSSVILIIGSVILLFSKEITLLIFVVYMLMYMVQMAYQPLIIAMNFEYSKAGCDIKFGLARGLGSAGFAVTSAIMGGIVEKRGCNVLLLVNIVMLAVSFIVTYFFRLPSKENGSTLDADGNTYVSKDETFVHDLERAHDNFFDFMKAYPQFALILLGTVCLFFAHNSINDYMFPIVSDLGGTKTQFGYATFLQAILELPMMAVITVFIKKLGTKVLITFSALFFFIKILILYFATNMFIMYVSQFCQLFAYSVMIPVAAYYVEEIMTEADKVKGQAYFQCAITISGVFSGLMCGSLVDNFGTGFMILVGCVVSLIGLMIIAYSNFGCKKVRGAQA